MRLAFALLIATCGCVDAVVLAPPPRRPIETFWLAQAMGEVQRPPPPSASLQSISLGYVGDAPLTGGMMLGDTEEAGEEPSDDDDDDSAARPTLLFRHGTVHIGANGPRRRRRR
jgi:hypothetical protein